MFLCYWHIKLYGLFNAENIILEEHKWYKLTRCYIDKRVHASRKDICPKANIIMRLKFEPAYYNVAVQHVNK